MFVLGRFPLYLLITWLVSSGLVLVFYKKKFWWRRFSVFVVAFSVSIYFVFGCTAPMSPKVNEGSIENGAIKIIEYTLNNSKQSAENETTFDINETLPDLTIVDDNVFYDVSIWQSETTNDAKRLFDGYTKESCVHKVEKKGEIEFVTTKFYRSRDWRYLGIASDCGGEIYILYYNYIVDISYRYERTLFEEFIAIICPPETFYREEIDLGLIDLEKASISFE